MLGCSHTELSELALQAAPGADGLTLLPYFMGERTPDLPHERGSLHKASLTNFTRANFARAIIEGTLASQTAMLDALEACGVSPKRLLLIGGGAQSPAVQQILTQMVPIPVAVPAPDEYVTKGAAMQAAAALTGSFPVWEVTTAELPTVDLEPHITDQHREAKAALGYGELISSLQLAG